MDKAKGFQVFLKQKHNFFINPHFLLYFLNSLYHLSPLLIGQLQNVALLEGWKLEI